jgi:Right handed beta helix region
MRTTRIVSLVGPLALGLALAVTPSSALPVNESDEVPRCLSDVQVRAFAGTPATIDLGQSTTLTWDIAVPTGCATLKLYLGFQPIGPTGSVTFQPLATAVYQLRAELPYQGMRGIAATNVNVVLPPVVTITASSHKPLLVAALNTPNTTINVANHVEMDLSNYASLPVAEGVQLLGGRASREPGPLLYTDTRPPKLLVVQGDNVRISGLRLRGSVMGVGSGDRATAISIDSRVNVEIDNNELSGWNGAAVEVNDYYNRIAYYQDVRVHDNYIHHNQNEGAFGYGVVVGHGARALIERNVFDWNRHAIANDGSNTSGYMALRNLVLEHGGLHRWVGTWIHTHQFDIHGQDNCGVWDIFSDSLYNCGRAGDHFEFRHNTFRYTADTAIKLRGVPYSGAFVTANVFKHADIQWAVGKTDWADGLVVWNNQVGVDAFDDVAMCDFDGDGVNDEFVATGATWWFRSGGEMHWVYLNTSDKRLSQLTLGYFDGDARCDVRAGDMISSGGSGPWRLSITPIVTSPVPTVRR